MVKYIYIFFFERDGEDFLLWKNCEFKIYGAINNQSMVQSITNHKIPSFFFLFLCLRVSMSVNSLFRQSISVDTKKDFPHVTDYNRKIPVFLSHNIKMRNRINCELAIASLQHKPFALFLKWRQKLEERWRTTLK